MDDDRTRAGGWLAVRLQEKSYPSLAPVTKLRQSPNMATVSRATGPSRRVSLRDAQTWSARPAADTSAAAHTSATAWIDFRVDASWAAAQAQSTLLLSLSHPPSTRTRKRMRRWDYADCGTPTGRGAASCNILPNSFTCVSFQPARRSLCAVTFDSEVRAVSIQTMPLKSC